MLAEQQLVNNDRHGRKCKDADISSCIGVAVLEISGSLLNQAKDSAGHGGSVHELAWFYPVSEKLPPLIC